MLGVAVPAALSNAVSPPEIAAVMAGFGNASVAAFGVVTRGEAFATLPMLALSSAIGPVAGQSWGEGGGGRVEEALRQFLAFCLLWSVAVAAACWTSGDRIARAFTDDPAVAVEAAPYLRIVWLGVAGYEVAAGAFNALGRR